MKTCLAVSSAAMLSLALQADDVSRLRGHIVLSDKVLSFEPCGEDRALWLLPVKRATRGARAMRATRRGI